MLPVACVASAFTRALARVPEASALLAIASAVLSAAALPAAVAVPQTQTLSSGSRIQLRLTTSVSSATARVGDAVSAVVTVDVPLADGVLSRGTVAHGIVRQVTAFSWRASQAVLWMEFRELVEAGGRPLPIATRLVAIDNGRETVDGMGRLLGITPPHEAPSSAEESILLAAVAPEVYDLERVAFRIRELEGPNITYAAGTDITIETTAPTPGILAGAARPEPRPDQALIALAAAQPTRTMAGRPPRLADVINFVFNGSDDELSAAFTAAGWSSAVALGMRADARTVLAVAEDRGYSVGPVSLETLDGRPPDRVFQKQTNTFDRRHHIRIWRLAQPHQGAPVWVASATHDVGVKFVREERTFTHRVETDIDIERQKIVDDLRFAGSIARYGLAPRSDVPSRLMNATDDAMTTDGRVAVVVLQRVK
jgi:hypothetical protein